MSIIEQQNQNLFQQDNKVASKDGGFQRTISTLSTMGSSESTCSFQSFGGQNNVCIYNTINIPDQISKQEKSIHAFLDSVGVNQINISQYLESQNKIQSVNVQKLFQEKKAAPNLRERRRLAAQNKDDKENDGDDLRRSTSGLTSNSQDSFEVFNNFKLQAGLKTSTSFCTQRPDSLIAAKPSFLKSRTSQAKSKNESANRLKMLQDQLSKKQIESDIFNENGDDQIFKSSNLGSMSDEFDFEDEVSVLNRDNKRFSNLSSPMRMSMAKANEQQSIDFDNFQKSGVYAENNTRNENQTLKFGQQQSVEQSGPYMGIDSQTMHVDTPLPITCKQ